MKLSIVTISFNQAGFLEQAILSVLSQTYANIEYIVVDPGSTDGSRDIIERYRSRISHAIFEPDRGPADGLNHGFEVASGEVFAFLNADDVLSPCAVAEAINYLEHRLDVDAVSGHSNMIDESGYVIRRCYSDKFSLRRFAYSAAALMQPSTFFRSTWWRRVGGFNVSNRSNWDAEFFGEMALQGAAFDVVDSIWSGYRLHDSSITASARMNELIQAYRLKKFERIMGRRRKRYDDLLALFFLAEKYLRQPRALIERLVHGPIYGRFSKNANSE